MQIEIMRCYHTPIRLAKTKNIDLTNVGENVEQRELSFAAGGNALKVQPLWKTIWWFLTKLNTLLS